MRRKRRERPIPRLPDPMLCLVFFETSRGVVISQVIGDFIRRPFRKTKTGSYWTSWRRLTDGELRRIVFRE